MLAGVHGHTVPPQAVQHQDRLDWKVTGKSGELPLYERRIICDSAEIVTSV
jgi:hypothetical protein